MKYYIKHNNFIATDEILDEEGIKNLFPNIDITKEIPLGWGLYKENQSTTGIHNGYAYNYEEGFFYDIWI